MENEEKQVNETTGKNCCPPSCCTPDDGAQKTQNCCQDVDFADDCSSKMAHCMNKCKNIPWIPVILGAILLALGYYLDAQVTRILWMIVAGFVVFVGIFGLLMINRLGLCKKG